MFFLFYMIVFYLLFVFAFILENDRTELFYFDVCKLIWLNFKGSEIATD